MQPGGLARKFLYNAAIISVGSAALIYWDRTRDNVPKQVRRLVHEAVNLEIEPKGEGDDGSLARRKWKEATITAKANQLKPSIAFNTNFFLACNLEEAGRVDEALREYESAINNFPKDFDYRSLDDATKNRVSVTLDRLAQKAQDEKDYQTALRLYVDALGVLATPEEVTSGDEKFLSKKAHVQSVAGLLNNMTTLLYEVGLKDEAEKAEDMSTMLKFYAKSDFGPSVPLKDQLARSNSQSSHQQSH